MHAEEQEPKAQVERKIFLETAGNHWVWNSVRAEKALSCCAAATPLGLGVAEGDLPGGTQSGDAGADGYDDAQMAAPLLKARVMSAASNGGSDADQIRSSNSTTQTYLSVAPRLQISRRRSGQVMAERL